MSSLAPVILYSFVARGTTVLCEKSGNFTGNFSQVAMQCLDKVAARPGASGATGGGGAGGASLIPAVVGAPSTSSSGYAPSSPSSSSSSSSSSQRVTYTCDRHLFNFLSEPGPSGLTFCAVSPESAGRALPFAFLERVAEDFHSRHENASSLASLPAHALDRAFSPRLALAADYVAEHPEAASKVASVQRQVDAVRDVMVENIERVLERGERIELLVDKTDGLRDQAARFQASGREAEDVVEQHEDAARGGSARRLLAARRVRLRLLLRGNLPLFEEKLKRVWKRRFSLFRRFRFEEEEKLLALVFFCPPL